MKTTNTTRRIGRRLAAATIIASAFLGGGSALARHRPLIDLGGRGSAVDEGWRYVARGNVSGRPFNGAWSAGIKPDGGSWPAEGQCTSGDVAASVDGPKRKEISIVAIGEICAPWASASAVRYTFTGEFDAYEAVPRRLSDTQGWIEIIIATDGSANLTLMSS
jgi:hypothetical protein